ncbi:MAG: tyrosine-type recombinase/integrase [Planctomycetaceae bacterium]|nr:tyrosine-type recombinase/integrase [Planctomycetaceae bacterium]
MGRRSNTIPKLCTDKNGRAFTKVRGRFISLGRAGTPESHQRYSEVLTAHARGQLDDIAKPKAAATAPKCLTVNELIMQFVTREIPRFSAGEAYAFRAAIKVLRPMFGETPVNDFGPLRYRLVRDQMVSGDPATGRKPWARPTVNRQIKRIRQIFRWGVSWELVQPDVVTRLDSVRSLAIGETTAHDNPARKAASAADVEAVMPHLKPVYADVLRLLALTGARRGEILSLTGGMLQRRSDCWLAELNEHKTARKGKRRFLVFNVAAQAILLRHLRVDPEAKIFDVHPDTFSTAVRLACVAAGVTPFVPHQLRHAAAAKLVDELGVEVAQAVLGHSDAMMTQHYSQSAERKAIAGVARLG